MSVYLDCAATTPVDPRVAEAIARFLVDEYGNPGSRTHGFGDRARQAVEHARDQVAAAAGARRGEVVFTSGATESNNLAILGLEAHGRAVGRMHLIASAIEHAACLEPLRLLESRGFALTLVDPTPGGWVEAADVADALREDTLLVSVMQVNNETGTIQPIDEIAVALEHPCYFHVDAAQSFGKLAPLPVRADLVSISAHKVHGPKGAGALIMRRRDRERPPLQALMQGGGQELGLRPGTLAPHQLVGFGLAAELAVDEREDRDSARAALEPVLLEGLASLEPRIHGERRLPGFLNFSVPGFGALDLMDAWAELVAISDGAACTTSSKVCSHVLTAMGLPSEALDGAVRLSWSHETPAPPLAEMVSRLAALPR